MKISINCSRYCKLYNQNLTTFKLLGFLEIVGSLLGNEMAYKLLKDIQKYLKFYKIQKKKASLLFISICGTVVTQL